MKIKQILEAIKPRKNMYLDWKINKEAALKLVKKQVENPKTLQHLIFSIHYKQSKNKDYLKSYKIKKFGDDGEIGHFGVLDYSWFLITDKDNNTLKIEINWVQKALIDRSAHYEPVCDFILNGKAVDFDEAKTFFKEDFFNDYVESEAKRQKEKTPHPSVLKSNIKRR